MGPRLRKTILGHLSLSMLLPIIRFSYGFALAAILSKYLPVDAYGQWSLFVSTMFLILTIASVNLMYAAAVKLTGKEPPQQKREICSVGLFKFGLTVLVYFAFALYLWLMDVFEPRIIFLLGAVLFFVTGSNFVFGLLRALLRLKRQVLFMFVELALIIGGVAVSVFVLSGGFEEAILAYLVAEAIAASFGLYLMRQYLSWTGFEFGLVKGYLRIGLPLLPFAFSDLIVNSLVPLMIKVFDSFEAVAIYSIAQKVALVSTIPNGIINNIFAQYLKRSLLADGLAGVRRTFFMFVGIYVAMAAPVFLGLYFFGEWVILLISTEAYLVSFDLMLILALVNVIIMLTAMVTTVFAVYDRTRTVGYIWLAVLVFYLLANVMLVPAYQMQGIAMALVVSFGLGLIAVGIAGWRLHQSLATDANSTHQA